MQSRRTNLSCHENLTLSRRNFRYNPASCPAKKCKSSTTVGIRDGQKIIALNGPLTIHTIFNFQDRRPRAIHRRGHHRLQRRALHGFRRTRRPRRRSRHHGKGESPTRACGTQRAGQGAARRVEGEPSSSASSPPSRKPRRPSRRRACGGACRTASLFFAV